MRVAYLRIFTYWAEHNQRRCNEAIMQARKRSSRFVLLEALFMTLLFVILVAIAFGGFYFFIANPYYFTSPSM
ncbi:hypothetical protein ABIC60_002128 [Phyllobacterium ifriqiyense]